eukprot:NODE_3803_length_741_cov_326.077259.p4 GENE.NODE_3803_length_741_cov_326.077259~~NODE_3803_length_741_cov_326.077259.p4  ORF type:complete len:113 (-),score=0.89 NODE_3803_length_741_cov_326.077259:331-669(-)
MPGWTVVLGKSMLFYAQPGFRAPVILVLAKIKAGERVGVRLRPCTVGNLGTAPRHPFETGARCEPILPTDTLPQSAQRSRSMRPSSSGGPRHQPRPRHLVKRESLATMLLAK